MQLATGLPTLGGTYTVAQVLAQLVSGQPAREQYFFWRLNAQGVRYPDPGGDLGAYVDRGSAPEVEHDATRGVKRTLRLRLRGDAPVSSLQDIIAPRFRLYMPDGGYVEWALGRFPVLPPDKEIQQSQTWLTLSCPDVTQVLVDASFTTSYAVLAGTNYLSAINTIVSSYGGMISLPILIPDPGKTLPASLGWEAGTTRLQAINDLLAAVNYFPLWADEVGTLRSTPIPDWNGALPSFIFDATAGAAAIGAVLTEKPDISRAYNQVLVLGEDPRRNPISALYINSSPISPVSTTTWGHPKMMAPVRDSRVVDLATALSVAKSKAQEVARIYSEVAFDSLSWPLSQDNDIYGLRYQTADEGLVNNLYVELGWRLRCAPGGLTRHTFTRIVPA